MQENCKFGSGEQDTKTCPMIYIHWPGYYPTEESYNYALKNLCPNMKLNIDDIYEVVGNIKHVCKNNSDRTRESGPAFTHCYEDDEGLWISNYVYCSEVIFCPVCGYKINSPVVQR